MKIFSGMAVVFAIITLIISCEFHQKTGTKDKDKSVDKPVARNNNDPVNQDGTILYNGIQLKVHKLKISKAYLIFANDERVPADNFIDFTSPVRIMLQVDSGWVADNNRIFLGASEKIITESGNVIANENDMYEQAFPDGVSPEKAEKVWLMADIHPRPGSPPSSFAIEFRVWDKKGEGYFEGSFKLHSK